MTASFTLRRGRFTNLRPMTVRRSLIAVGVVVVAGLVISLVMLNGSTSSPTVAVPAPAASVAALAKDLALASPAQALPPLALSTSQLTSDVTYTGFDRGCLVAFNAARPTGTRPANCFFGDQSTSRTLVLYGDSNADMWLAAFDELGRLHHFRVELVARASCQIPDLKLWNPAAHAPGVACTAFRKWALGEIARIHPFVTIVSDYEYGRRWDYFDHPVAPSVEAAAVTRTLAAIAQHSTETVLLATPPALFVDPTQCLSLHSRDISRCGAPVACLSISHQSDPACTFASSTGRTWALVNRLHAASDAGGAHYVNVDSLFCSATACPAVVDHLVVNFDLRHVSLHYSVFVSRALGQLITSAGVALGE
jgi:hypothetical protein